MGRVNHEVSVARRKLGVGEDWQTCRWEILGDTRDAVLIEGRVPHGVYTRGPRKGQPKFAPPYQKCVVTDAEIRDERARFELETGSCAECGGTAETWAGWNVNTGDKWRPCRRCNATGKAP